MLATFLTLAFIASAVMAIAVIAASFAKGFAAASDLRRQLAECGDVRMVTVRHERAARVHAVPTMRALRRPARPALPAVPARRRAAA